MSDRKLGDFDGNGAVDGMDSTALMTYLGSVSMCKSVEPISEDTFYAGNILKINDLKRTDAGAIQQTWAKSSTRSRVYNTAQPAYWADPSSPDNYKKYYYLDAEGHEVSLANESSAPTWVADTYYYYTTSAFQLTLSDDYVSDLVTYLP